MCIDADQRGLSGQAAALPPSPATCAAAMCQSSGRHSRDFSLYLIPSSCDTAHVLSVIARADATGRNGAAPPCGWRRHVPSAALGERLLLPPVLITAAQPDVLLGAAGSPAGGLCDRRQAWGARTFDAENFFLQPAHRQRVRCRVGKASGRLCKGSHAARFWTHLTVKAPVLWRVWRAGCVAYGHPGVSGGGEALSEQSPAAVRIACPAAASSGGPRASLRSH